MKRPINGYLLIILLASCAPLTKTQVKTVNSFAQASKNFSAYPSKIMVELANVRLKRGVYFANSIENPRLHQQELDSVYRFQKNELALTEKTDITFKIIDKYAQSLVLLTSDKYVDDLRTQTVRFGIDLDSLTNLYNAKDFGQKVPTSIGSAISQVVAFGGTQFIKRRQAREIKKFVPRADQLIGVMTDNLIQFLDSKNIYTLIQNEEQGVGDNYLSFLRQSRTVSTMFGNKDTMVMASNTKSLISNDLEYLKMRETLDNIKELQKETITATKALRKAHAKLLDTVKERRKLQGAIAEVQELYAGVREVQKTIEKIEKYKSPLDESND